MPPEATLHTGGQGVIDLRGEPLPYVRLRDWFKLPERSPQRENIVVVEVDHARAGLAVDALYGARQTVIKPLGRQFQAIPGIAGSAILGNGRVALILDIAGLIREVIRSPGRARGRAVSGKFRSGLVAAHYRKHACEMEFEIYGSDTVPDLSTSRRRICN